MSENRFINLVELDDLVELVEMQSQYIGELGYRLSNCKMNAIQRADLQRKIKVAHHTVRYDRRRLKELVRGWIHEQQTRLQQDDNA